MAIPEQERILFSMHTFSSPELFMNPAQEQHEIHSTRVTLQALSTGDLKNIERALKIDYISRIPPKLTFLSR
jgi:hypothetical protein